MNLKTTTPIFVPRALLFFGLPALLMTGMFWGLIPFMDLMGIRLFHAFLVAFGVPMLILIFVTLRFYRKEGGAWRCNQFCQRFRLQPMTGGDWIWTLALLGFVIITYQILDFTSEWISELIPEPKFMFRLFDEDPNYFMEVPLQGNWLLFSEMALIVLCVAFGEELWFRGYVLPRQELAHGTWAWLLNALFWSFYCLFMPWRFLQILPAAFAIAYVAHRRKNTWTAVISHIPVVPGVVPLIQSITG